MIMATLMLLSQPVSWSLNSKPAAPLPSQRPPSALEGWMSAWQGRRDIEAQLDTSGPNCGQSTGITCKSITFTFKFIHMTLFNSCNTSVMFVLGYMPHYSVGLASNYCSTTEVTLCG